MAARCRRNVAHEFEPYHDIAGLNIGFADVIGGASAVRRGAYRNATRSCYVAPRRANRIARGNSSTRAPPDKQLDRSKTKLKQR